MSENNCWIFMSLEEIIDSIEYEKGNIKNDRTNDDKTSDGSAEQSAKYT